MAHLEVSEHVCSTNLCCDALELAFVLEQLTDLFFTVVHCLVQPADDVACKCLDREWHGAICVKAQEVCEKLLRRLEVL